VEEEKDGIACPSISLQSQEHLVHPTVDVLVIAATSSLWMKGTSARRPEICMKDLSNAQ